MQILLFGSIGYLGGAQSETWDTIRLWRQHQLPVAVACTPLVSQDSRLRLLSLGCTLLDDGELEPFLARARSDAALTIAVGICSQAFLDQAPRLANAGCPLVWMNCVTRLFGSERQLYPRRGLFDAYVFQSEFQAAELSRQLAPFGFQSAEGHLIRGAFCADDWHCAPRAHDPEGDFVLGKIARPDFSKWSRQLWPVMDRIAPPHHRGLVMGVDESIRKWLGPAPAWAEILPPSAVPAADVYRRLHCLLPLNHSICENWPRIGLEAMATGVPIVAPREGGWCDMIAHGETGFLAGSADELVAYATELAGNEPLRLQIAEQARHKLETELANPDLIWAGWNRLFQSLAPDRREGPPP